MNVLLLSGGGFQGHTVLKELNAINGVNTFVLDIYKENVTRYFTANYHTFVRLDHPDFRKQLLAFCKEKEIDVVFPSTYLELEILSQLKESSQSFKIACCSPEIFKKLSDKRLSYEFLEDHHFPVGKKILPEKIDASNFFPVIAKSAKGFGGKDIRVLKDYTAFATWMQENEITQFALQEYVEDFTEYSADFAIDFAGNTSEILLRNRLRQSGGFAVVTALEYDNELLLSLQKLAALFAASGGCGLFNVQILKTPEGFIYSDINPRIGTSAVLGQANGNNLCAFILQSVGIDHVYTSTEKNSKAVRYLEERFVPEKKSEVKTLIFDLDDTLFPQKKWIIGKLELLFDAYRPDINKSEFLSEGLRILEEGHRSDLIDRLADVFPFVSAHKSELISTYRTLVPTIALYNDVHPTLLALKKHGFQLGLLTDNPPASQRQKIEAAGLEKYFDKIVYSREAGGEKPAATSFQTVLKELKADSAHTAFVGDNLYKDILGAHCAGIPTLCWIQREGGFFNFDADEFRKLNPSIPFHKFQDLYHLISFLL